MTSLPKKLLYLSRHWKTSAHLARDVKAHTALQAPADLYTTHWILCEVLAVDVRQK